MCYSNSTIVNIYWHCRKLVYKIIVNGGGYRITYSVASYRVYSPYIYNIYIYIYIYTILQPTRWLVIITPAEPRRSAAMSDHNPHVLIILIIKNSLPRVIKSRKCMRYVIFWLCFYSVSYIYSRLPWTIHVPKTRLAEDGRDWRTVGEALFWKRHGAAAPCTCISPTYLVASRSRTLLEVGSGRSCGARCLTTNGLAGWVLAGLCLAKTPTSKQSLLLKKKLVSKVWSVALLAWLFVLLLLQQSLHVYSSWKEGSKPENFLLLTTNLSR
jgi:hypothetical protein